jgi:DNA-binding NarL/FixJ family response regulator
MRERLLSRVAGGALTQAATTVDELTDRELQVYRLIGKGVKTQEIAEQLHLSVKTVETYRDRIKKKLELKDATELIRSAALWSTQNA